MTLKNFIDNDIYFMVSIGNTIIINNNYEGVFILDPELHVIKEENLLEDLVISDCFVNHKTKEVMLYAYQNHCFIYLATVNHINKKIPIQKEFEELSFMPLYEWKSNELLLPANDGETLICTDISEGIVKEVTDGSASPICSEWKFLSEYIVQKVYPCEKLAVIEQENDIKILDMEAKQVIDSYSEYDDRFHDVEICRSFFAVISKCKIVIYHKKKCILHLVPMDNFYFLRGKFLIINKAAYFYALSSCNSDVRCCKLQRYLLDSV